ncbi:hypothetical protein Q3H58_000739 [Pseudomonas psychrotolerans]|nr:hypothetical protein [Pseudomonas psychrotolerans]
MQRFAEGLDAASRQHGDAQDHSPIAPVEGGALRRMFGFDADLGQLAQGQRATVGQLDRQGAECGRVGQLPADGQAQIAAPLLRVAAADQQIARAQLREQPLGGQSQAGQDGGRKLQHDAILLKAIEGDTLHPRQVIEGTPQPFDLAA